MTAGQKIRPALSENHQQQVDVAIATTPRKNMALGTARYRHSLPQHRSPTNEAIVKTIGTVVLAALAASAAGGLPTGRSLRPDVGLGSGCVPDAAKWFQVDPCGKWSVHRGTCEVVLAAD